MDETYESGVIIAQGRDLNEIKAYKFNDEEQPTVTSKEQVKLLLITLTK